MNLLGLAVDAVEAAVKIAIEASSAASMAEAEVLARLQTVLVSALVHVDAALAQLGEARAKADAEIAAGAPKV